MQQHVWKYLIAKNKQCVAHVPFDNRIECLMFKKSFSFFVDKLIYSPWLDIQPEFIASMAFSLYFFIFGS